MQQKKDAMLIPDAEIMQKTEKGFSKQISKAWSFLKVIIYSLFELSVTMEFSTNFTTFDDKEKWLLTYQ